MTKNTASDNANLSSVVLVSAILLSVVLNDIKLSVSLVNAILLYA